MTRTAAGFAVATFVGLGSVFSAPLALADAPAEKPEVNAEGTGAESGEQQDAGKDTSAEGGKETTTPDGDSGAGAPSDADKAEDTGAGDKGKDEGDKDETPAEEQAPENVDPEPLTLDTDIEEELDFDGDYIAQKTYAYTCTAGSQTDSAKILWTLAHSGDGKTGEPYVWAAGVDNFPYYYADEPVTNGTFSGALNLSGAAAPQKSLTATATAQGPVDEHGNFPADKWNYDKTTGTFTPLKPGKLTFTPGTVTIKIEQASGTVTTTCTPSEPATLASVDITGKDMSDKDNGNGNGSGSDKDNNGETGSGGEKGDGSGSGSDGDKNTEADTSKPAADKAGAGLPVTGAALGGLVAAGAAALGGGGAAMYFSRKKKAAAADATDAS
ncbi:hypothetical protein CDO52_05600 [Nocardiopsis gilva YIM 90087]|uniref:Gram-positive cocci surface proteins LPxTG domain-containing protein n=2 Tax=Nocardiopsis gilva TaxID=280236 RepID=A0A223S2I5_9ACTN|nr:hypothetical protein [Nocardiopsis gilva]ASU82331.1 hypothetical protein CDO52_05600 [Nocardiopsis gilva YIM 90087]